MRTRLLPLFASLLSIGTASAQDPSFTLSVVTPATLSAQVGTVVDTVVWPAGAISSSFPGGWVQAAPGTPGVSATIDWYVSTDAGALQFALEAAALVATNGAASVGDVQLQLLLDNPTQVPLELRLARSFAASAGSTVPSLRIDVGADGSFELTEADAEAQSVVFLAGGTWPRPVRFQLSASAQSFEVMRSRLSLTVVPQATSVLPIAQGCSTADFQVLPRFDGSLGYAIDPLHAGLSAAVFGLGQQPLYLGNQTSGGVVLPCLLLPTPDVIAYIPTAGMQLLPLPPVVRPVVFRAQSVQLLPTGFGTSAASQVFAY